MGQRLQSFIQETVAAPDVWQRIARSTWRRILAAAAGSPTPDAAARVEWALQTGRTHCRLPLEHADVCGAAAASGDLALLAWLRDRNFPWGTAEVLAAVVRHADLPFVQRLEQDGGYLPPAEDREAWASEEVVAAAAASARDSAAKLQWLAGRGADLGSREALYAAAAWGNLEAVQLLAGQQGQGPDGAGGQAALPSNILKPAVTSGSVAVATWLRQAGYPWGDSCFGAAFRRGDLPMVRWLLEAGCPRGQYDILWAAVNAWPCHQPGDSGRLVEALRLLAAAGWLAGPAGGACFATAALHLPNQVLVALRELLPDNTQDVYGAYLMAASGGCEAMLEAMVGTGERHGGTAGAAFYARAAAKGDRGTLECLVRLGVPLGEGALAAAIERDSPVPALKWLVAQGAPRGGVEEALRGAPPGRREEVEAWLGRLLGPSQGQ